MIPALLLAAQPPIFETLKPPQTKWEYTTRRHEDDFEEPPFKILRIAGALTNRVYPDDAEFELRPTSDPDLWVGRALYSRSGAILVTYGESFVVWKGKLHVSPSKWPFDQINGGTSGTVTLSKCTWLSIDGSNYESAIFDRGKWITAKQVIPFRGADGNSYRMRYIIPTYDPQKPDVLPYWTSEKLAKGAWMTLSSKGEIFDVSPGGKVLIGNSGTPESDVLVIASDFAYRLNEPRIRWIGPGPRFVSYGFYGTPEESNFRVDEGKKDNMKPIESAPDWPKGTKVEDCFGWSNGGWLLKVSKAGKSSFAIFRPKS